MSAQRLVIRGGRLYSGHPDDPDGHGDIAIVDGRIVAIGSVDAQPDDRTIDASEAIVTPGLINTHHHLYQWMTRGHATGCNLFEWLVTLYPMWGRMSVDDVHAAAVVGLAELARSGCTTAFDHHYVVPHSDDTVFDAIVEAAQTIGIRLHLSRGSMDLSEKDGGLPPDHVVEDRDAILTSTESVIRRHHDGEMVSVVVAPCSPFSVTQGLMEESAQLARRMGVRMHTHLCETVDEERHCLERFGRRPLELMDEWGWTGNDVWYAHGIWFDDTEVARLGETGTGVAHCPSSNARLAAGTCRTADLVAAGAPVGLGVDGVASNEVGWLQPELRQSLYAARLRAARSDTWMPRDSLALGTIGGARCLGIADAGRLQVGQRADLAIWGAEDLMDLPNPGDGLVLGRDRHVKHLVVNGDHVVADGDVVGFDLATSRRTLAQRAEKLREI